MTYRTLFRSSATVLLLCLALSAPALADSHARIVRLSYLNGEVQIDRGLGQGYERALMHMPVIEGTKLWTQDGAQAEIEFEDGSTVRMAPATSITFYQLGLAADGAKVSTLDMDEGTAYFDLVHPEHDTFLLRLPKQDLR